MNEDAWKASKEKLQGMVNQYKLDGCNLKIEDYGADGVALWQVGIDGEMACLGTVERIWEMWPWFNGFVVGKRKEGNLIELAAGGA